MSRGLLTGPEPGYDMSVAPDPSPNDPLVANTLAALLEKHLDVPYVDPFRLQCFLRDHFSKVSALAHAIHDREVRRRHG
jgi:hypothetical protein